jgi:hypothetical protein
MPYFVKQCKDNNVCYYKYHVELDLLRQGLNGLKDGIKGAHVQNDCTCQFGVYWQGGVIEHDICQAHTTCIRR